MHTGRSNAIEAVDVLNYLIADFVAGTEVFINYRQRFKSGILNIEQLSAVQRMCFSHLALSFCKLLEFWDRYHQLVSSTHYEDLKKLNAKIRRKGVKEFRNKVAGHILDNKSHRPLQHSEIMLLLEGLIGKHADDFLYWINNPLDNTYPNTVVSIVETIRNTIAEEYAITPDEIIKR